MVDVAEAQRQVRSIYVGGFVVLGGVFIFPLTQLLLRASGRPASLPAGNPLRELAIEIAFLVPLLLPVVGAATLRNASWFYPATMVVVGAHYLPFSFLYGMRQFIGLAGVLTLAGLLIGLYVPSMAVWGCWFTSAALVVFAFIGRGVVLRAEPLGR
jgi:Family of unknown function (DUF7010)